jgi:hypothetical protein
MFTTAVAEDPRLVAGKVIREPGVKLARAPLGNTKKVNARSGAVPFAVKVKTEGWLFSVKAMETWPVTLLPVEGRYWTANEAAPFGDSVTGKVGRLARTMADVPLKERDVIVAELAPV